MSFTTTGLMLGPSMRAAILPPKSGTANLEVRLARHRVPGVWSYQFGQPMWITNLE
jgi:hypothetical protein